MLMFILAISCLTTFNLPWFMGLTIQGPMLYCSLQHWVSLLLWDTSTTACHFCFGPTASSFQYLLVIALYSSPVAHLIPYNLGGGSYSGVTPFCLFMLFMGFSQQEYRRCLPFPPPVDHVLSELSSMTHLFWMVLHGMAHSVSVLCKPLCHNKAVIQERGFQAYCYIKGQHLHLKLII